MARFATDIIEPIKQKIKKTVSGPSADIALNEIADNETCQLKVIPILLQPAQKSQARVDPVVEGVLVEPLKFCSHLLAPHLLWLLGVTPDEAGSCCSPLAKIS